MEGVFVKQIAVDLGEVKRFLGETVIALLQAGGECIVAGGGPADLRYIAVEAEAEGEGVVAELVEAGVVDGGEDGGLDGLVVMEHAECPVLGGTGLQLVAEGGPLQLELFVGQRLGQDERLAVEAALAIEGEDDAGSAAVALVPREEDVCHGVAYLDDFALSHLLVG